MRVLVAGDEDAARLTLEAMHREPQLGWDVAACLTEAAGAMDRAEQLIPPLGVQEAILAFRSLPAEQQSVLAGRLQPLVDAVHVIPHPGAVRVDVPELTCLLCGPAGSQQQEHGMDGAAGRALKRLLYLAASVLLLPLALLLMAAIALAVRLDSQGPAFYADRRLSPRGGTFRCYKFRTMFVNNDTILAEHLRAHPEAQREWEQYRKLRSYDPRLTRVGRILRKCSLDEVPQLFNVLRGEMSLVGPRPYRPDEADLMGPRRALVLAARPGVTGLWQVTGRNEIPFEQRVQLEAWYSQNWSFWLDLVLLMRTVAVVALRVGSY